MGLHDKLAYKALLSGKTAAEFNVAAQKHANATWAYLIAAGVVWYFAGFGWALIPGVLGIFTAIQSISSTMIATRLENYEKE